MRETKRGNSLTKHICLLMVLLLASALVSGCRRVDVLTPSGGSAPLPVVTATEAVAIATATEAAATAALAEPQTLAPTQAPDEPEPQETATAAPPAAQTPAPAPAASSTVPITPVEGIERVDIYYDATLPMLGFADIPGRDSGATNAYMKLLDALPSALTDVFARASRQHYRVDTRSPAAPLSEMPPATLMSPSFYLAEDMRAQPQAVRLLGADAKTDGQRMNEFMTGYYASQGLPLPSDTSMNESPAQWALANAAAQSGGSVLSVVITDLSELRRGIEPLRAAMAGHIMDAGLTLGILGIHSDFAGFTPLYFSGQDVWMEWGAQPTGSIERVLLYEAGLANTKVSTRYQLPMSIDPAGRASSPRPVYVLCAGPSDAVNACLRAVAGRLSGEGAAAPWRAYDAGYLPAGHVLEGKVELAAPDGENAGLVTVLADAPEGFVASLQLYPSNTSNDRFIEFLARYQPSADDPRAGHLSSDDFDVSIQHTPLGGALPAGRITAEIVDPVDIDHVTGECVLRVRVHYPVKDSGFDEYDAQISLALKAYSMPGTNQPGGFGAFINASDSTQDIARFDGSRTLGLGRLLDALDAMHRVRASDEDMGAFTYRVRIVDPT